MPETDVQLCELTSENVLHVLELSVKPEQAGLVASNAKSVAQAYVTGEPAWPRAVYAGGVLVGFVMLYLVPPGRPESKDGKAYYYVWRLMIDAAHQGRGYGRAAMRRVIEYVRTLPDAESLYLSYVPQPVNPEAFYRALGFEPTGEMDEGEIVMRLGL